MKEICGKRDASSVTSLKWSLPNNPDVLIFDKDFPKAAFTYTSMDSL